DAVTAQATAAGPVAPERSHADLVAVRRRGAGTDLPPNA
ncbi:biotin synthase BioB, partial [Streptomyces sp. SID8382]|nr:biotin synthase BioB [Streptomyces sp. SID8382]